MQVIAGRIGFGCVAGIGTSILFHLIQLLATELR